jgi:hypothetical protein
VRIGCGEVRHARDHGSLATELGERSVDAFVAGVSRGGDVPRREIVLQRRRSPLGREADEAFSIEELAHQARRGWRVHGDRDVDRAACELVRLPPRDAPPALSEEA